MARNFDVVVLRAIKIRVLLEGNRALCLRNGEPAKKGLQECNPFTPATRLLQDLFHKKDIKMAVIERMGEFNLGD
jgi:hypothetical protein